MSISQLFASPYAWGVLTILVLWGISRVITGSANPFALACGADDNYSASLLQFLIFTYLTVFAYVAVYAARLDTGLATLPDIPLNLLVLMGLSVASATASKGIVISYIEQGKLPADGNDKSGVVKDKTGSVALTKVQMLIWTFIAAVIYFITVLSFIDKKIYAQAGQSALPDVDGALLVLMGAAQGGYIGGKLVNRSPSIPIIERILSPISINAPGRVKVFGTLFGDSPDGNTVLYRNTATGAQREVPAIPAAQWTDGSIEFDIPTDMQTAGNYTIWIRSQGQMSRGYDIEMIP
jgi:hypothetical protein